MGFFDFLKKQSKENVEASNQEPVTMETPEVTPDETPTDTPTTEE